MMTAQEQAALSTLNWVMENLTSLASIAYVTAFGLFLFYIFKRAGSMHFLRDRAWRLMGGKSDFLTPELQKLKLESRELEHFRFEFGVPAKSIRDIELFEQWISAHKISLKDVTIAKEYIDWTDYTHLKTKQKNLIFLRKTFKFFGIITLTFSGLFFVAAIPNHLMASFDDTPFFYISTKSTLLSLFGGNSIDSTECKYEDRLAELSQNSEFPLYRLQYICSVFENDDQLKSLNQSIDEQKTAALSLAIFFALVMFYFARESKKVTAAQKIRETLEDERSAVVD